MPWDGERAERSSRLLAARSCGYTGTFMRAPCRLGDWCGRLRTRARCVPVLGGGMSCMSRLPHNRDQRPQPSHVRPAPAHTCRDAFRAPSSSRPAPTGVHTALVEAALRRGAAGGGRGQHGAAPVQHLPLRQLLRVQGARHRGTLAGTVWVCASGWCHACWCCLELA